MKIESTKLSGVMIIEPAIHHDPRGLFVETYQTKMYAEQGHPLEFVQDNHSRSKRGILRGLHQQLTQPQGKLVRVIEGSIFDVAEDIRVGASTFGVWMGVELSGDDFKQLYVPPGFAHEFCVISD